MTAKEMAGGVPLLLLLLSLTSLTRTLTQAFTLPHSHTHSHSHTPIYRHRQPSVEVHSTGTDDERTQFPPYPQLPTTRTNSETSQTAEADLALRRALSFETTGQARYAHAHFHEAATLYQCLIEEIEASSTSPTPPSQRSAFAHVTEFDTSEPHLLNSALSYACARLAYPSVDALGDPHAAARLYPDAVRIDEKHAVNVVGREEVHAAYYDGTGTAIEAAYGNLDRAIDAYRTGLARLAPLHAEGGGSPSSRSLEKVLSFHLSIALERLGGDDNASESWVRSLVSSIC